MIVQQGFQNVFSYAAGVENWVRNALPYSLHYTFVQDFAIADWYGRDGVEDTYRRVKDAWLSDYKAFTEVAVSLNMLAWANDALRSQGYDGRDEFVGLYSDLYYRCRDDFYEVYSDNEEACQHFFEMTD